MRKYWLIAMLLVSANLFAGDSGLCDGAESETVQAPGIDGRLIKKVLSVER